MYATRLLHLFVVAVSAMMVAQAAWLDFGFIGKATQEIAARAGLDSLLNADATTTDAPAATATTSDSSSVSSASPTSSDTPSSTSVPTSTPTSTTTTIPTSSSADNSQPASKTTSSQPTTPADSSTTSSPSPTDASTSDSTSTTAPYTTVVVVTETNSAGQVTEITSSSVVTPTALSSSDSTTSTMTKGTRNTIIGVCVGVGGAIILAVVGVLFWRLRRNRQQDDHDEINYGAGTSQFNSGPEKSEASASLTGRSPFQSTLESYHAPTQSNAGTNF
ncbi:hypothetical protein BX600DRAFT_513026 [Xylariales sp. PMI_506]|nr:hypothetical protein BX600DRAFT_513026 [Xylariales sp. PMI_506]